MYLIIVGAGTVSSFLIRIALDEGHDVALIERNKHLAQQALEQYDIQVFHANIVQENILDEAGISHADALIATTDDDAVNLMTMFLGMECGIKTLISVVNERAHQNMFKRLGAHVLVDPESIIAHYLYRLLLARRVEDTVTLPGGETLFAVALKESAPLVGKTRTQARNEGILSKDMLIVSIKRDGECMVDPDYDLEMQVGDQVIAFSQTPLSDADTAPFTD
jgi:trk system potassium uptake protein TrkA